MKPEQLIERYLANSADETDLQQIITQIEENADFREQFVESIAMAGLICATAPNTETNEEAIMCGIGGGQCSLADVEAVMASLEPAPKPPSPKKFPVWLIPLAAAAIIVIAALQFTPGDPAPQNIADSADPPPPEMQSEVNGTLVQYDSVPAGIPPMLHEDIEPWAPIGPVELTEIDGPKITLSNDALTRELRYDGQVWRTMSLRRADRTGAVDLYSHVFRILLLDGTAVTADDYKTSRDATVQRTESGQTLKLVYTRRSAAPAGAPETVTVTHQLDHTAHWIYKTVTLEAQEDAVVDRLDVERFVSTAETDRGGRGEPTFLNHAWYLGLEFPAGHTRHPRFQPRPYAHVGNHSYIDLDGYDREDNPPAGLVAAFHFPGKSNRITSKRAILGVAPHKLALELAFRKYLKTIRRPSRAFVNYNNWYDASGKNLHPANFADTIAKSFQENLAPYGVSIDAMVPDNGWQDNTTISHPQPSAWPDGLSGLATRLESRGTSLGLWIAANNYNTNIDSPQLKKYPEAVRNERFKNFRRYLCIVDPNYRAELFKSVENLFTQGRLSYVKHDFNNMCCSGEGHGHLPTDRHGHEASVDAMIALLAYERDLNPDVYQNLTNWTWFSPWWLQHADSIWMLGKDSALAGSWPQLSTRDMAITYRDAHLHSIWGDSSTRPLVPISALMTHGIIFADRNRMGDQNESLREWSDYVMAYYGRGVQLHELYITPTMMTKERWQVLGQATRWAQDNQKTLENAVYVGGNPANGECYGYVAWHKDRGILTARNPHLHPQTLEIPVDESTWYTGPHDQPLHARVIYPHRGVLPQMFSTGTIMRITIPGHTLMTMELNPGPAHSEERLPTRITATDIPNGVELDIPDRVYQRLEFLTTSSGDKSQVVRVNNKPIKPTRSKNTKHWAMNAIDLSGYLGQRIQISWNEDADTPFSNNRLLDAWLLADQQVERREALDKHAPVPVADGFRRKTQLVVDAGRRTPGAAAQVDLNAPIAGKLHVSLFGVNGGKKYAGHKILLNGKPIATLPATHGDNWESHVFDLPSSAISDGLLANNVIQITNPADDSFKFANLQLALKAQDGRWLLSSRPKTVHVSIAKWAYAEGTAFVGDRSKPITLRFKIK